MRQPLRLAVAYLCLMPIFATVYAELLPSGSFHDSNLEREPSHFADRDKLETALADTIRAGTLTKPWTTPRPPNGSTTLPTKEAIIPASVRVDDLRISRQMATFTVSCLVSAILPSHSRGFALFSQRVRANLKDVITDPDVFRLPTLVSVSASGAQGGSVWLHGRMPLRRLFRPATPQGTPAPNGDGWILMRNALYAAILRFRNAEQGDASSASSRWLRMLYFSATAVTTLGFGDITPVTTMARTWVTAEALLGIVLIGLFLNALALRAGDGGYISRRDST